MTGFKTSVMTPAFLNAMAGLCLLMVLSSCGPSTPASTGQGSVAAAPTAAPAAPKPEPVATAPLPPIERSLQESGEMLDRRDADVDGDVLLFVRVGKEEYYAFNRQQVTRKGLSFTIPKGTRLSIATIPNTFPNVGTRFQTVVNVLCCQSRPAGVTILSGEVNVQIPVVTLPAGKTLKLEIAEYIDAEQCGGRARDSLLCRV